MTNIISTLWRDFFNKKNYNLVNIAGLSIGISCALAIMLWAEDEMKFDSFNENANQMYRILVEESGMSGFSNSATTMPPLANALKEKLPEVVKAASFEMDWQVVVKAEGKYLNEEGLALVGTDFFEMFSFPFLKGSAESLKTDKNVVVISEKSAKKYFGNVDPVGKNIEINKTNVQVVGVLKNIDYNSHISFDLAIPEQLGAEIFHREKENWDNQCLYTYIQVSPNVNKELLATKIYSFIPDQINKESQYRLLLQPLNKIHFQKQLADEDYTKLGDIRYVYIFSFIGIFILILACINFINLSTAVSEQKTKNTGIRKILGAKKARLVKASILKSLGIASLAGFIALLILYLIIPYINTLTGKNLNFNFLNPFHLTALILIITFTGVFAGIYPAFYLASFSPINIIKKNASTYSQNLLRKGLVVFQFSLSIILISATFISSKQLKHIQKVNLGFDQQQTIYIPINTESESKYQTLKNKLLQNPEIGGVAGKDYFSTTILFTAEVDWQGNDKNNMIFSQNSIDADFFPLLKIDIIKGRNFSKAVESDKKKAVIINKSAQEKMGLKNPIGTKLTTNGRELEIVGLIDDIHFKSVNEKIQPEFYTYSENPQFIFVKYNNKSGNFKQTIYEIEKTVKSIYPETPFEFNFLDSTYARLYENDKRVGEIFRIMAIIAIFISCLGLFGLSSYSSEKRIKEIGVRKVNGAKIFEIIQMLNKDFVKWVAIAFIIACPIAWYAMHKWLENFAYKTELSWWIFVLAGFLALVVALLTVSWQSWRAATRNPVEALRYE